MAILHILEVSALSIHVLHQRNYLISFANKKENDKLGVKQHYYLKATTFSGILNLAILTLNLLLFH